jgi:hypothetical protein
VKKLVFIMLLASCDDRRISVTVPDSKMKVEISTQRFGAGTPEVCVNINAPKISPLIVVPMPFGYERKPVTAEKGLP